MPKLLGNRIYLEMPKEDAENKLYVDENTKEALQRELLNKMSKLKVLQIGTIVTEIKVGDYVLVDPAVLNKATLVPISEDGEERAILVSPFDIIQIW
jgi:exosome complex RNA-binding protein Rrp42 (RNase PH superfamily)